MWNLLKINSRDCVSLLATCNMSKTFFKCFFFVFFVFFFQDVPTRLHWVFHLRLVSDVLETYRLDFVYVLLRRRHSVSTKHHGGLPLRRLGDVPWRLSWVFHLRRTYNVAGTYRDMSLQRRHDVLLPGEKWRKKMY